jgi:hypothetical protein
VTDWTPIATGCITAAAALGGVAIAPLLSSRATKKAASRESRRVTYLEMLTLLTSRKSGLEKLVWAPNAPPPPDIDEERIARHDALLDVDATPEVRQLARRCYRLMSRFLNSYTMGAPVDVDEHGFLHYRFDLVRNRSPDEVAMTMRISLGQIHDEFVASYEELARQIRSEIHGP